MIANIPQFLHLLGFLIRDDKLLDIIERGRFHYKKNLQDKWFTIIHKNNSLRYILKEPTGDCYDFSFDIIHIGDGLASNHTFYLIVNNAHTQKKYFVRINKDKRRSIIERHDPNVLYQFQNLVLQNFVEGVRIDTVLNSSSRKERASIIDMVLECMYQTH